MGFTTPHVRVPGCAWRLAGSWIAALTALVMGCGSTATATDDAGPSGSSPAGSSSGGASPGSSGSGDGTGPGGSSGSPTASSSGAPGTNGDGDGAAPGRADAGRSTSDAGAPCTKVVTPSMDCSAPLAPGDSKTCMLGSRQYLLYAPKNLDVCEPTALVIDAHGELREELDFDPGPGTAATESSFATELADAATQTLHSS